MDAWFALLLGLLLRLGIPLAITILVFVLLRRLDERWRREALSLPAVKAPAKPCWEAKACPEEMRKSCQAVAHPETPCWQIFRAQDGALREGCLDCDVFRQAPVPVRL